MNDIDRLKEEIWSEMTDEDRDFVRKEFEKTRKQIARDSLVFWCIAVPLLVVCVPAVMWASGCFSP